MPNSATSADATIEGINRIAFDVASKGSVLVRFRTNVMGLAVIRRYFKRITKPSPVPCGGFQGVPVIEDLDVEFPLRPGRIVAVLKDVLTGDETERTVYGAAA